MLVAMSKLKFDGVRRAALSESPGLCGRCGSASASFSYAAVVRPDQARMRSRRCQPATCHQCTAPLRSPGSLKRPWARSHCHARWPTPCHSSDPHSLPPPSRPFEPPLGWSVPRVRAVSRPGRPHALRARCCRWPRRGRTRRLAKAGEPREQCERGRALLRCRACWWQRRGHARRRRVGGAHRSGAD